MERLMSAEEKLRNERILARMSIKMHGYDKKKVILMEDPNDPDKLLKKVIHNIIKYVTRMDDEQKIVLHCEGGTCLVLTDEEFHTIWRDQGKRLKKKHSRERFVNYDTFFNENCRPDWCKTPIKELMYPYYNPKYPRVPEEPPHFFDRDFTLALPPKGVQALPGNDINVAYLGGDL